MSTSFFHARIITHKMHMKSGNAGGFRRQGGASARRSCRQSTFLFRWWLSSNQIGIKPRRASKSHPVHRTKRRLWIGFEYHAENLRQLGIVPWWFQMRHFCISLDFSHVCMPLVVPAHSNATKSRAHMFKQASKCWFEHVLLMCYWFGTDHNNAKISACYW